jgi:hypothetical protein
VASSPPPSVRRCRLITQGTKGVDVVAVKRALSRAGFMRWGPFTPLWGRFAAEAAREFQRKKGISPVTAMYGPKTHRVLVKTRRKGSNTEWAYDAYSIELMDQACAELTQMPENRIRDAIVAEAARLYARRNEIDYVQSRPFALKAPPFVPPQLDCSAFATVCHFVGGAPDPNARNYDGHGYTGTLMSRGVRCAERDLEPGDLVFYGRTTMATPPFPIGSPTHVALYDGDGGVYSQGGPNPHNRMKRHPVKYRSVNHYRHY